MSDGRRAFVPLEAHDACTWLVSSEGGAMFFSQKGWRARLRRLVAEHTRQVRLESDDQHRRAIEDELDRSRSELNARLGTRSVRHVCLPWGVSGRVAAAALARLGFDSAVANRWRGSFAVHPGDHPFWLKRLPNRYVFALPGRRRRTIFTVSRAQ
jgi:hypothetical protein